MVLPRDQRVDHQIQDDIYIPRNLERTFTGGPAYTNAWLCTHGSKSLSSVDLTAWLRGIGPVQKMSLVASPYEKSFERSKALDEYMSKQPPS
jgi:hypothetical protein